MTRQINVQHDRLSIYLLGRFRISIGEVEIPNDRFRLRKARNLLKILALASGHQLRGEQMMELLWPESDPELAANNLHQAVHAARRALESAGVSPRKYLSYENGTLSLDPETAAWIDVDAFESASAEARQMQDPNLYRAALALYTGDLLLEDLYEEWAVNRREVLRQEYLRLLLELGNQYETSNEIQPAIEIFQKLVSADPAQEEAHVSLMRLYALLGQRQSAIRQYQTLKHILKSELDIEPEPVSTNLYRNIISGRFPPHDDNQFSKSLIESRPNLLQESAGAKSLPGHNLPIQLTSFIGRQKELSQVKELVANNRLVTLTGSGGVGKTRLSLQLAESVLEQFQDGVWYVELAPISNPDLVPQIVASTIGLREEPGHLFEDTLIQFLRNRQVLLVLDNCEHLLEVCAHLADTLLKKAARLKMIVSSRQALEISGESTFRVPSLSAPDPHQMPPLPEFKEYEAVRLFSQRAQAVLPSFQVDEHNAPAIAQICQQLDGIPLALELAAARLSLLGPSQLASRLNDALRLLSGSNRTAMPRQQTLRATIDWSYQLLSEQEQCLLKRLAIFAGGATLEAIESICAGYGIVSEEILDLVNGLANKSMVSVEQFHDSEPRYQLLETVRQYAGEKLVKAGECATFEERRLEYYLNLVETFEPLLRTPVALERLKDLNREAGNLRACLSWSLDRGTIPMIEAGLRMASALWDFWHNQNYIGEGLAWLTKGLNRLPEHAPAFLKTRAKACFAAGWLTGALGRQQDTIQWWDKSLEIYRKLDSRTDSVMVKICLCEIHAWVGDSSSQVKKLCEESLEDARSQNDPWLLAFTLHHYGLSAEFLHEYFLARQLLEESLSICEKVGDRFQRGNILISIGVISYFQGDYSKARKYLVEALDAGQELESDWIIGNALGNLAEVDYMQGEYLQMETNLRFALEIFRKYGNNLAIIWTLRDIGIALKCQGKFQQALEYFLMTLPLAREQKDSYGVYTAIAGVARALASLGYTYRAVRLLGAVETLLSTFTKPMNPHELKEFKKDILVAKAALSEVDFSIAWVEGCSLTLEAAIQETLSSGIENQFRQ